MDDTTRRDEDMEISADFTESNPRNDDHTSHYPQTTFGNEDGPNNERSGRPLEDDSIFVHLPSDNDLSKEELKLFFSEELVRLGCSKAEEPILKVSIFKKRYQKDQSAYIQFREPSAVKKLLSNRRSIEVHDSVWIEIEPKWKFKSNIQHYWQPVRRQCFERRFRSGFRDLQDQRSWYRRRSAVARGAVRRRYDSKKPGSYV